MDTNTSSNEILNEFDPLKKDISWAERVVTMLRMYSTSIVDVNNATDCQKLLYGDESMQPIKKLFKDDGFLASTKFKSLNIMEGMFNTFVEETTKVPPHAIVKAEDPFSITAKEKDLQLLKSRRILERDISQYQTAIGLGPYKMPYDKFEGNAKEFDDAGFNPDDTEDVDIYTTHLQKLFYEIGAQSALNAILKLNKFNRTQLRSMVADVLSCKTVAAQVFVNQVTGEIRHEYIDPRNLRGIFGNTNDGKGDLCRIIEQRGTVAEWLSRVGNEFSFKKHWKFLLHSINTTNNSFYSGFNRGGTSYSCLTDSDFCEKAKISASNNQGYITWDNVHLMKINFGYIEWLTNNSTGTWLRSEEDCMEAWHDYELTEKEIDLGYQKETKYQQQWLRSYYLSTSSMTQYLFGFQPVYFQHIHGLNDEYSNGTVKWYQERGDAAAEIAKPYINVATVAFYKFLFLLSKLEPQKDEYNINELLQIGRQMAAEERNNNPEGTMIPNSGDLITRVIELMDKSHIKIRAYPVLDGKTHPVLPPNGKVNDGGVDGVTFFMQQVIEWAESRINKAVGMNSMRMGANPPSRESLNTEQNIINSSQNATGYMYRMIQYIKEDIAVATLNYCTDIVHYKDTLPYKWLYNLIGAENIDYIKKADKNVAHLMGVFMSDINTAALMNEVRESANIALQRQEISFANRYLIISMDNPHLAIAKLAVSKRQEQKRIQKDAERLEMLRHNNAMQLEAQKQKTVGITAGATVEAARVAAMATIESARTQAEGRKEVKQIQVDSEGPKQELKSQGQQDILEKKKNLEEQEPIGFGV